MKLFFKSFLPYFILGIIGLFFFFYNLDNWYLWEDEALYALLSKNILRFKIPYIYDGINILGHDPDDFSVKTLNYIVYGWFPLYLNSFSFILFGINTFSARFFSSFFGIFLIIYSFIKIKSLELSKGTSFYSALIILFSIPLLLFFRQCQYYALTVVLSFIIFINFSYYRVNLKNKFIFIISSLLLLNTNYLAWLILMIWSFITAIRQKSFMVSKIFILTIVGILSFPFFFLYELWNLLGYPTGQSRPLLYFDYLDRVFFYVNSINIVIMPYWYIILLFISSIVLWKKFKENDKILLINGIILIILTLFLVPIAIHFIFFRYVIFIIPILLIMTAVIIFNALIHKRFLGIILLSCSIFFHIFNFKKDSNNSYYSYLNNFIYELTHESHDINEVLAKFLNKHAKPNQTILCAYGDFPLMFYTSLKVYGGPGQNGIFNSIRDKLLNAEILKKPDWIVIRKDWHHLYPKNFMEYFLKKYEYEEIILNVEDSTWGCRPSPFEHFFSTPIVINPLKVYKLRE